MPKEYSTKVTMDLGDELSDRATDAAEKLDVPRSKLALKAIDYLLAGIESGALQMVNGQIVKAEAP